MTTIQSSFGLIVSLSTSISIWCMKVARESADVSSIKQNSQSILESDLEEFF